MSEKRIATSSCWRAMSFSVAGHDLYTSYSAFQDKTDNKNSVNKQKGLGGHHQENT